MSRRTASLSGETPDDSGRGNGRPRALGFEQRWEDGLFVPFQNLFRDVVMMKSLRTLVEGRVELGQFVRLLVKICAGLILKRNSPALDHQIEIRARTCRAVQSPVVIAMALWFVSSPGQGQLAITEVMSAEAGIKSKAGSDFWELTNLGSEDIDLAGYYFRDNKDDNKSIAYLAELIDTNAVLHAGQCAIFLRETEEMTNVAQFVEWWGDAFPKRTIVRIYGESPGFSSIGDQIRLFDPRGTLVDSVVFGAAMPGVSFTCDPVTGEFGLHSKFGERGAFWAAMVPPDADAPDLASPGKPCDPIPMAILQQPLSMDVCGGTEATFSVRAAGLPRPKYQWYFEGVPIEGETKASFTITNVTSANEGAYKVLLSCFSGNLWSSNASLTIRTSPQAPQILVPPFDIELYKGQAANYSVTVCAFPPPSYQWFVNGVPIEGETGRTLRLSDCGAEMSGSEICVRIENELGFTNACASLRVSPTPQLLITEIFALATAECSQNGDWFEVTNVGTNQANLSGFRTLDEFQLEHAIRLTNSISIAPGESVILAERMTPEFFKSWWGADRLPPTLQVITFAGFGLKHTGGTVYLWNSAAESSTDALAGAAYAGANPGRSLYYSDSSSLKAKLSEVGVHGAFMAETCGDIGSPGYVENPAPRFLRITRQENGVLLEWRGVPAQRYRLCQKSYLTEEEWLAVGEYTASSEVQTVTDTSAASAGLRFYRLEQLP